jgi:hypothetical protein
MALWLSGVVDCSIVESGKVDAVECANVESGKADEKN